MRIITQARFVHYIIWSVSRECSPETIFRIISSTSVAWTGVGPVRVCRLCIDVIPVDCSSFKLRRQSLALKSYVRVERMSDGQLNDTESTENNIYVLQFLQFGWPSLNRVNFIREKRRIFDIDTFPDGCFDFKRKSTTTALPKVVCVCFFLYVHLFECSKRFGISSDRSVLKTNEYNAFLELRCRSTHDDLFVRSVHINQSVRTGGIIQSS